MTYSLSEGLMALAAYGVIVIANEKLSNDLKLVASINRILDTLFIFGFLTTLGMILLSGIVEYIIMDSMLPISNLLVLPITFALVLPVVVPHFDLFAHILSAYNVNPKTTGVVCGLWGMMAVGFMMRLKSIWLAVVFPLLIILFLLDRSVNQSKKKVRNKGVKHLFSRHRAHLKKLKTVNFKPKKEIFPASLI